MHAAERNRAMSEALGEDVYHYHLHVVYIPVVEKQILWSKRCKGAGAASCGAVAAGRLSGRLFFFVFGLRFDR